MILREFNTPTKLFITGIDFKNILESFKITDDYCAMEVLLNEKSFYFDTCGFVFILTEEEFLKIKDKMDEDDSDDCLVINDFVGNIDLYMVSPSGVKWLPDPIDFNEYLQYHDKPEDDWYDVFLQLTGTYSSAEKYTGSESVLEKY